MLSAKEPLKCIVIGNDKALNTSICQRIIFSFPDECICNSRDISQISLASIRASPPDLLLFHSIQPSKDLEELNNTFLGNPPPLILLTDQEVNTYTNLIHPSIIHVMKLPILNEAFAHSISSFINGRKEVIQLNDYAKTNETIMLSTGNGWQLVDVNEIIRLNSDGNYITFHITGHEKFTVIKTMKYYEQKLPSGLFFRVHQSHIINFKHIKKVETSDGYSIFMDDGSCIPLSKEKKDRFKSFLQNKCIS